MKSYISFQKQIGMHEKFQNLKQNMKYSFSHA